jgi:hypothetical protein
MAEDVMWNTQQLIAVTAAQPLKSAAQTLSHAADAARRGEHPAVDWQTLAEACDDGLATMLEVKGAEVLKALAVRCAGTSAEVNNLMSGFSVDSGALTLELLALRQAFAALAVLQARAVNGKA